MVQAGSKGKGMYRGPQVLINRDPWRGLGELFLSNKKQEIVIENIETVILL